MTRFVEWVQDQCSLKSSGETLGFLTLSALGWVYILYQYLYASGLSEAIPTYAGY